MEIEYDENKRHLNIAKHGVWFEDAAAVFLDPERLELADSRLDYGEERHVCLGLIPAQSICGRVFCVVYTLRNNRIRLISARKANAREQNNYYFGRCA